ncbi:MULTISPECIES: DUF1841 family protein [Microvirgula]|uniref:DUF1841 domain-containing protein n=1 Tax=Microvirgula aerodenitrificans TaxID=57480 RepID=A0A2S0P7T8_9NEIS|nr:MULTISPECIES: DUF1841 family protein [Microvirgula]AVY93373.1 DUF1841 domain-containing protein [Microvirgula aerodenitrificans]RAS19888.1 uncharacterized protein DUF1841 [Microvirgula sp. AG722]
MFNPSRDEARRFLFDTWQKHHAGQPLTDLERIALAIELEHPEYQPMLADPDRYLDRDWRPEGGETNPFLHMMMHLSIEEQVSIDQPAGVRDLVDRLAARLGTRHDAQHAAMDGLAEMIWLAQRNGSMPDPNVYLNVLRRRIGEGEAFDLARPGDEP